LVKPKRLVFKNKMEFFFGIFEYRDIFFLTKAENGTLRLFFIGEEKKAALELVKISPKFPHYKTHKK